MSLDQGIVHGQVFNILFASPSTFQKKFDQAFYLDRGKEDSKVVETSSSDLRVLSGKERKEIIDRCRQMKKSLPRRISSAASYDKQTIVKFAEYDSLKKFVRSCCALQIQALWRGYRTRKVVSCAFGWLPSDRVNRQMISIFAERKTKNRPLRVADMSLDHLSAEKDFIKSILVNFDKEFKRKTSHMPSKKEKERFRPLYRLYNQIKERIEMFQGGRSHENEIERLRKEKRELQVKLNNFEANFKQVYGRPIKWESDIQSMKADYERYKQIKLKLEEFETI